MTTLETDRLTLRMLREADFEAYAEMCADPEVMRYIGDGQPLARPIAWRNLATMIGHWTLRGYGMWAVEEKSSRVLVGRIGFWNPDGWPGFELGWMLRRNSWGKGFATEAARIAPSIRVAQRLGERLSGSTELMGKPTLVYRISREEWGNGSATTPVGALGR